MAPRVLVAASRMPRGESEEPEKLSPKPSKLDGFGVEGVEVLAYIGFKINPSLIPLNPKTLSLIPITLYAKPSEH